MKPSIVPEPLYMCYGCQDQNKPIDDRCFPATDLSWYNRSCSYGGWYCESCLDEDGVDGGISLAEYLMGKSQWWSSVPRVDFPCGCKRALRFQAVDLLWSNDRWRCRECMKDDLIVNVDLSDYKTMLDLIIEIGSDGNLIDLFHS